MQSVSYTAFFNNSNKNANTVCAQLKTHLEQELLNTQENLGKYSKNSFKLQNLAQNVSEACASKLLFKRRKLPIIMFTMSTLAGISQVSDYT